MRVFISYASADRALAAEVSLALTGAGHHSWFDSEQLRPGDDFRSRLEAVIRDKTDAVVFLASTHSVADGCFALTEMRHAQDRWPHPAGHLVTVRLNDVAISAIPVYLRTVTLLEQKGSGDLPAEVVRAVNALRRRRLSPTLALALAAVVIVPLAYVAWTTLKTDPVGQLSDSVIKLTPVESLAVLHLNDPRQRTRVYARMLEFLAVNARRPIPLAACSTTVARAQAADLGSRSDVRAVLKFLRDTSSLLDSAGGATLDSTNLQGMNLRGAKLRRVSFNGACVDSTEFRDASLEGASFNTTSADAAIFTRARLDSSRFVGAILHSASFFGACLRRADFTDARLEGAVFRSADIGWTSFYASRLSNADGWEQGDSSRSNALFLTATGLTSEDTAQLRARGAIFGGTDFAAWSDARQIARLSPSTVPACQHRAPASR